MDSLNDVCSGISMDLGRELKTASAFVLFFYFQEVSRKIKNKNIYFLSSCCYNYSAYISCFFVLFWGQWQGDFEGSEIVHLLGVGPTTYTDNASEHSAIYEVIFFTLYHADVLLVTPAHFCKLKHTGKKTTYFFYALVHNSFIVPAAVLILFPTSEKYLHKKIA